MSTIFNGCDLIIFNSCLSRLNRAIVANMNWTQIIEDITKRGYTMANVARIIGVEPVTIQALRHGRSANPQWPTGDALIRLHKKVMRKYPKVDTVA